MNTKSDKVVLPRIVSQLARDAGGDGLPDPRQIPDEQSKPAQPMDDRGLPPLRSKGEYGPNTWGAVRMSDGDPALWSVVKERKRGHVTT